MILKNSKKEIPLVDVSLNSDTENFQFIQGLDLGINAKNLLTLELSYLHEVEDFPGMLSKIFKL